MKNEGIYQQKYRINTTRLKHHDYTHGMYFITICVKHLKCVFGEIVNGLMKLNKWGKIVKSEWQKTEGLRENVKLGEFVIMPNHFHGIISVNHIENSRDVARYVSTNPLSLNSPKNGSLPAITRSFKSSCTRRIRKEGFANFQWQPRFYDHLVRDDRDYQNVQLYINQNPQKWENDKYFTT